ncbi:TraB/GumN family protein [Piscinibacter sp. HJYY11]|uniref:TraB/GumN family protein n=1 Tax=Piscinibacter sp. HJYY11 TaxID=2801333 RepID=UPI00191CBD80|nr:TraB/GumN family protein [Piscinibacter sp. HJYY11]MBL0729466.1 TraB/GumN family protein [Piscinibacter sp. HJYY11]
MMSTLRRWLTLGCAALALQAHAKAPDCPPPPSPSAEAVAQARGQARDRGFLWRIRKDGRTSWLYGTLHVGRLAWVFPGPKVSEALQGSQVAAFELDFSDEAVVQRLLDGLATAARDPAAPRLPDDLAVRLRRQMEAACVPADWQQSLPPEMLGVTLSMMVGRHDGLETSYAIDPALARLARSAGKELVSLETPELQIDVLRSKSAAELRENMDKMLGDLERDRVRPLLRRVADAWAQGRAAELSGYRSWCECARTPQERESLKALLDDRNGPMAQRIDALHTSGKTVFAAVGSLHMFGPTGLPALMAARGYEVVPVELYR